MHDIVISEQDSDSTNMQSVWDSMGRHHICLGLQSLLFSIGASFISVWG